MGLKQSIIVVNEFSVPTGNKGGTRGGTPGKYVLRYMARSGATEDITPVRLDDADTYITRYMARKEATEKYDSVGRIKQGMRDAQGLGGVAFGVTGNDDIGDVSMSHHKIKQVSKDIQHKFEEGKTVLKTVIAFDLDYLHKMGIVEPDFVPQKKGDYRGHVDQMKLRLAIMDGMKKMSRGFDDLEYVGVIQIDTMHVHCHLCIVDKGRGRLMDNGEQKGKLSERDRRVLRRGIDMALDEMHPVKMLASSVAYDRRNARCFIKKFTHQTMAQNGTPQFLLACLPKDKNLWRAGTNCKEMQKANAITREYVEQALAEPDSGYDVAMRQIGKYAQERANREDLNEKEQRQLINAGRERLLCDCMNGVYSVLRTIPDERRQVKTPMLETMSMEYNDMAAIADSDPMLEFGFRLRSYSSRLKYHRQERHKYHEAVKEYEAAKDEGQVSPESKPLYDFYQVEEEYNAMLMAKYQHFLNFLPPEDSYEDDFDELMDYRTKMANLWKMTQDKSMSRRSANSAEDYGRRVYEMHGGRFMVTNPSVLDDRLDAMTNTYKKMADEFEVKLEDNGMFFESDEHSAHVVKEPAYDFDTVKALDLHHLGYDFPYDTPISKPNVDIFARMAHKRATAFVGAKAYLEQSGQGDVVKELPVKDIKLMNEMADRLQQEPLLLSVKSTAGGRANNGRTIRLDDNFQRDMKLAIQATVAATQFGE